MKRCLMITGGKLSLEFAEKFLEGRSYEFVIAADAGLASADALGIRPDVAVGDFDTLGKTRLQEYRSAHSVPLDIHRPEKDETDTELAFLTAFRHGCTSMDILGATGGRLDHEFPTSIFWRWDSVTGSLRQSMISRTGFTCWMPQSAAGRSSGKKRCTVPIFHFFPLRKA